MVGKDYRTPLSNSKIFCTYQSVHRRKVYRSWATVPAIPPWIRHSGGGLEEKCAGWLNQSHVVTKWKIGFEMFRNPLEMEWDNFSSKDCRFDGVWGLSLAHRTSTWLL